MMANQLTGPHAIVTRSLNKRFGRIQALAGVNLTVPEGSVYVLVGPNGVGKTTTLKVLLGLEVADSGTAEVLGIDCRSEPARVRAQIGWVSDRREVGYGWMRVSRLIRYHAAFHPAWDERYSAELIELFDLDLEMRFGDMSNGAQRRVELVLALAHKPPVVIMDEPTSGLDPVMRERALSGLASHLARFPTTIVMATHHVNEAERLGDHLGVMRDGRIETQLDRETLRGCLRTYHLQVPEQWSGAPALADAILVRSDSARELTWTILGDETEVAGRLHAAGATIRHVQSLSLEDAALAFMSRENVR